MRAVLTRLAGASLRAALVAVAVVIPALLVPNVSPTAAELAILSAAIAAAFVILEYGFQSPTLIEFRFAAPYNRFRFAILMALLLMIALAFREPIHQTGVSIAISSAAGFSFTIWDFPGSPLRFFLMLAEPMGPESQILVGRAAALALSITTLGIAVFGLVIWAFSWPLARDSFNLWTNMPNFDSVMDDETQASLRQSAHVSIVIGLCLPYLAPQAAMAFMGPLKPVSSGNSLFLVWMIAIWCFIPAASILRAVALYKIANLLAQEDYSQS